MSDVADRFSARVGPAAKTSSGKQLYLGTAATIEHYSSMVQQLEEDGAVMFDFLSDGARLLSSKLPMVTRLVVTVNKLLVEDHWDETLRGRKCAFTTTIDQRFVDREVFVKTSGDIIVLDSACGTGKTEAILHLARTYSRIPMVYVTASVSLCDAMAAQLEGFVSYSDDAFTANSRRVVSCINSIGRVLGKMETTPQIIILDEASLALQQANTMYANNAHRRQQITDSLKRAVSRAAKVVICQ